MKTETIKIKTKVKYSQKSCTLLMAVSAIQAFIYPRHVERAGGEKGDTSVRNVAPSSVWPLGSWPLQALFSSVLSRSSKTFYHVEFDPTKRTQQQA